MKRKQLGAALDASVDVLNVMANTSHAGAAAISASTEAAKDLLSTGFGNLTQIWNDLLNKYQSLISRAVDPTQSLPGLNDRQIPAAANAFFQLNQENNFVTNADLRTMITTNTTVYRMAAHFAMAEYILLNNLSYSISISPSSLTNLNVNAGTNVGLTFDEHATGKMVTLICNSYLNLAYSACLLELINQLKANSLFNETVIVTGGEFSRSPRNDGAGSDHGYMGGSSAIYSGIVDGPLVLGNIYLDKSQGALDTGTWGYGAPVSGMNKSVDLGHWASTIAEMLRVPSPVTASPSLVRETNGVIFPLIEKAKQIA